MFAAQVAGVRKLKGARRLARDPGGPQRGATAAALANGPAADDTPATQGLGHDSKREAELEVCRIPVVHRSVDPPLLEASGAPS